MSLFLISIYLKITHRVLLEFVYNDMMYIKSSEKLVEEANKKIETLDSKEVVELVKKKKLH